MAEYNNFIKIKKNKNNSVFQYKNDFFDIEEEKIKLFFKSDIVFYFLSIDDEEFFYFSRDISFKFIKRNREEIDILIF